LYASPFHIEGGLKGVKIGVFRRSSWKRILGEKVSNNRVSTTGKVRENSGKFRNFSGKLEIIAKFTHRNYRSSLL